MKPTGVQEHCREGEIKCWLSIFQGVSFLTATLRRRKMLMYSSVLTVLISGLNSSWKMPTLLQIPVIYTPANSSNFLNLMRTEKPPNCDGIIIILICHNENVESTDENKARIGKYTPHFETNKY